MANPRQPHEPRLTGTKICTSDLHKGNRELPVLAFSVHKPSKDGLLNICRECNRIREKHTKSYIRGKEESTRNKLKRIDSYNQQYYHSTEGRNENDNED